jgi:hypothetical protein
LKDSTSSLGRAAAPAAVAPAAVAPDAEELEADAAEVPLEMTAPLPPNAEEVNIHCSLQK